MRVSELQELIKQYSYDNNDRIRTLYALLSDYTFKKPGNNSKTPEKPEKKEVPQEQEIKSGDTSKTPEKKEVPQEQEIPFIALLHYMKERKLQLNGAPFDEHAFKIALEQMSTEQDSRRQGEIDENFLRDDRSLFESFIQRTIFESEEQPGGEQEISKNQNKKEELISEEQPGDEQEKRIKRIKEERSKEERRKEGLIGLLPQDVLERVVIPHLDLIKRS